MKNNTERVNQFLKDHPGTHSIRAIADCLSLFGRAGIETVLEAIKELPDVQMEGKAAEWRVAKHLYGPKQDDDLLGAVEGLYGPGCVNCG